MGGGHTSNDTNWAAWRFGGGLSGAYRVPAFTPGNNAIGRAVYHLRGAQAHDVAVNQAAHFGWVDLAVLHPNVGPHRGHHG